MQRIPFFACISTHFGFSLRFAFASVHSVHAWLVNPQLIVSRVVLSASAILRPSIQWMLYMFFFVCSSCCCRLTPYNPKAATACATAKLRNDDEKKISEHKPKHSLTLSVPASRMCFRRKLFSRTFQQAPVPRYVNTFLCTRMRQSVCVYMLSSSCRMGFSVYRHHYRAQHLCSCTHTH